jgi:hypothetical protein
MTVISPREAKRRGMCFATLHPDDNETLYCGTHDDPWPCGQTSPGPCRVIHPKLPQDRGCDEPAGHRGPHAVHDSCGRPEYWWNRSHWAFTGRDENGDLDGYVCHCAFGDNHADAAS